MRVLIVDDHPLYREGLKALLSGLDPDIETVAVGSVAEAITAEVATREFDLVLLDMNLPGISRLDAVRAMKGAYEAAAVVVVSGDDNAELILETIEAGAAGYVPKTTDTALTIQALRVVLAHGVFIPSHALRSSTALQARAPAASPLELSPKQRLVLDRLLQGKSNKVIARELEIAEGTVKAHLWAVYQMLGVTSRTQALCRMHELGLLGGHPVASAS